MPVNNEGITVISDIPDKVSADEIFDIRELVERILNDNLDPVGQIYLEYDNYTTNSDIKEKTGVTGNIYDADMNPLTGVSISAKSIDAGVYWIGEFQNTLNNSYKFEKAPVGVRVEIKATKQGYATRTRTIVVKTSFIGDPDANKYDFGGTSFNSAQFFLQDEPEITNIKINGITATNSGTIGILNPEGTAYFPTETTSVSLNNVDNSKFEIEMNFSEPVDKKSVQSNFRVYSEITPGPTNFIRTDFAPSFTLDGNSGTFTWSNDDKTVLFKATNPLPSLDTGTPLRYKLTFVSQFSDKSGKLARNISIPDGQRDFQLSSNNRGFIKYSASVRADYLTFSNSK